eukprot:s62_g7.t1
MVFLKGRPFGPKGRDSKTEVVSAIHLRGPDGLNVSLLQVRLHTGRRHQIRAHLAHEGHPLLGDSSYGGPEVSWCPRIFLHASRLVVNMEEAGGEVDVTCPLPEDLQAALHHLEALDLRGRSRVKDVEAARAEVQRLRAELRVWQSTEGWTFSLAGAEDRRHRMDLEETSWKADKTRAERDELSSALKEQRNKAAQILAQFSEGRGQAPSLKDTKHLEDEVQRVRELALRMRREVQEQQEVETYGGRQQAPHEAVTSSAKRFADVRDVQL